MVDGALLGYVRVLKVWLGGVIRCGVVVMPVSVVVVNALSVRQCVRAVRIPAAVAACI